jgi:hypothetical protein
VGLPTGNTLKAWLNASIATFKQALKYGNTNLTHHSSS